MALKCGQRSESRRAPGAVERKIRRHQLMVDCPVSGIHSAQVADGWSASNDLVLEQLPRQMNYRPEIDGLRAVAVLSVILAHAGLPGFEGGYVGVDVFFVISGFLITSILVSDLETGRFSLIGFYERRARRILPALLFLLLCLALAGFFLFPPWQYLALSKSTIATVAFVSNLYLMRATGDYFGSDASYEPLMHTWSLGVEEQFYIFFPLILALAFRGGRRRAALTAAVLVAGSFAWSTSSMPTGQVAAFFMPHLRAWELGVGAILVLFAPTRVPLNRMAAGLAGMVGLGLILACVVGYTERTVFPGGAALPVVVGTALVIWATSRAGSIATAILTVWPLVWTGRISYSLYLWHWPPIVIARTVSNGQPTAIMLIAAVSFAFLAAWASWRFVEQPFRLRSGPRAFTRRGIFQLSAAGSALTLSAALVVGTDHGMKLRLPEASYREFRSASDMSDVERRCRAAWWDDIEAMCPIGTDERGAPSVLLWGDSHAAALIPGVDAWLRSQGLLGWVFVVDRCPPLPGLVNRHLSWAEDCITRNNAVLEVVRRTPSLKSVILAGRWSLSYHGTRFAREPGDGASVAIDVGGETKEGPDAMALAMRFLLSELVREGRQAIVIGAVPEVPFNVPRRFLDDAFFKRPFATTFPAEASLARTKGPDTMFEGLVHEVGGTFVPMSGIFCGSECRIGERGRLLYRDDDHVSEYGAEWAIRSGFEARNVVRGCSDDVTDPQCSAHATGAHSSPDRARP
ncbi:acyltransferase family protein [Defluviimonas sp. SAOS-178_SWC]|uniref:acyltransferase family protein n=1 Tax=Defluviimonas sp. SAOS-178_SWC TaxID=3121287 RepID=UPI0032217B74